MNRILVIGELNVDLVMSGLPSMPVLGQELLAEDFKTVLGSSSAITALRLAALGADVSFIGWLGDDTYGRFVLNELSSAGIHTNNIRIVPTPTGVTIALTYPQDRALLTFPGTIAAFDGGDIEPELLSGYDHLHVGSFYLQTGLQPALSRIFEMAKAQSLTTSLDPGWDPNERWSYNPYLRPVLAYTDYFLPNQDETTALAGGSYRPEILEQQVHGKLVIKRGAEGAAAYDPSGLIATVPALNVDVVDTTGAGDAFNAGFLYAVCVEQMALIDALSFGIACGADAVTHIGGATDAPVAATIHALLNARMA